MIKAHCEVYILEAFLERILTIDDANCKHVLIQLMKLYGVYRLSIDAADFIEVLHISIQLFVSI